MAECIVPAKTIIVKCRECETLYVPDMEKSRKYCGGRFLAFEECPTCGYDNNTYGDRIPLWKYNLIKFMRGGFRNAKG